MEDDDLLGLLEVKEHKRKLDTKICNFKEKRKKVSDNQEAILLEKAIHYMEKESASDNEISADSEDDIFGKFVAAKLKSICDLNKEMKKFRIHSVLGFE
uniref:Uncharacterized protein n=1 Tax=Amphimedon queenslandica TaxID=400682 RepID=A0A1X7TTI8_AMPQE